MGDKKGEKLYLINKDVTCLSCGTIGAAVQLYGVWYPRGLGDEADKYFTLRKYKNKPYMGSVQGAGGVFPWECLACGNTGLIDITIEGIKTAFTAKSELKEI